jgi:hypothetical protein
VYTRRNHITQKVRIAGERTLDLSLSVTYRHTSLILGFSWLWAIRQMP